MHALRAPMLLLAFLLAGACSAGESAEGPAPAHAQAAEQAATSADFAAFWREFRAAVLAADAQRAASLTRFPLEVRGPDDGDPVEPCTRAEFEAVFARLIAQVGYVPAGDHVLERSLREIVETLPAPPPKARLTADFARVEQFEFRLSNGRWQLTRAYLEE